MNKLQAWKESRNRLCLDLRSKQEYKTRHLIPSTNIPLQQLSIRQAELPLKQTPFSVLEPTSSKGCSSWLINNGWTCPWVFNEDDTFWQEAEKKGLVETDGSDTLHNSFKKPWILFNPSPLLEKNIEMIENGLTRTGKSSTWTCLDIGCGSGRDISWILSRNKYVLSKARWRVSAIDSQPGSILRAESIINNMNLRRYLDLLAQAKLMNDGNWKLVSNLLEKEYVLGPDRDYFNYNTEYEPARRLKRKLAKSMPGLATADFFNGLNAKSTEFDLVLNIRFLSKPFLYQVPELLKVGGYFMISHFLHDQKHEYQQPKRNHRLEVNEIKDVYDSLDNMEIIKSEYDKAEDGRPIQSVIVQKIK